MLNQQAAGNYAVQITNSLGQQMYEKIIKHSGGKSLQEIKLDRKIISGLYHVTVTDAKGNKQTFRILVNN